MKKRAVLYMIAQTGGPYVKIGVSEKPFTRLRELQQGSPLPLYLVGIAECDDAGAVEAQLHQCFHNHRACSEWFLVSIADVSAALAERGLALVQPKRPARRQRRGGYREQFMPLTWERGRNLPTGPSTKLLDLIEAEASKANAKQEA